VGMPYLVVLVRAPSERQGRRLGYLVDFFTGLIGCKVGFLRVFALYMCLGIVLTPLLNGCVKAL
jgi:hypothetical protein